MSRKSIAILLSSALLLATVTSAAGAPASLTPASASQTAASAKNQPPLTPGPARIKKAQGLEDDDLGPGIIIGSIAVATGLLFWLMFHDDEDDTTTTGT